MVELNDFTIAIVLSRSIKGQTIADFMAEISPRPKMNTKPENPWQISVNGSSASTMYGAGSTIPTSERIDYPVHFEFPATNNATEYEAIIAGEKLVRALGDTSIKVHTDSRLVANKILGNFSSKENSMSMYVETTRKVLGHFTWWEIVHISQTDNMEADVLARLEASAFL